MFLHLHPLKEKFLPENFCTEIPDIYAFLFLTDIGSTPANRLTCLRCAGRPTLSTVQEVLPHQVLCLGLVTGALRVVGPQTGTSGAAACA